MTTIIRVFAACFVSFVSEAPPWSPIWGFTKSKKKSLHWQSKQNSCRPCPFAPSIPYYKKSTKAQLQHWQFHARGGRPASQQKTNCLIVSCRGIVLLVLDVSMRNSNMQAEKHETPRWGRACASPSSVVPFCSDV